MLSDPLLVVSRLAEVFDGLGILYVVGGSLASSVYGVPRATQDADLMAAIETAHVEPITQALAAEFYVDATMILDAIRQGGAFNVIHLATMFKADVFISKRDSWSQIELERARIEQFQVGQQQVSIRFASPEDTVLHKLMWYQLGGQTSDRQWHDVLGVFRIQGESLDLEYLERWAALLNVTDLLARVRAEA